MTAAVQFTSVRWLSDQIPKTMWEKLVDWWRGA